MDTNNKMLLICLALLPSLTFAHSGGKDKYGCHHDRKNGGYHCHNGGSGYQGQSAQTSINAVNADPAKPQALTTPSTNSHAKAKNAAVADSDLVFKIQSTLNQLGYAAGQPDGVLGKQTVKAIKHFQVDNDLVVDGKVSDFLLGEWIKRASPK